MFVSMFDCVIGRCMLEQVRWASQECSLWVSVGHCTASSTAAVSSYVKAAAAASAVKNWRLRARVLLVGCWQSYRGDKICHIFICPIYGQII